MQVKVLVVVSGFAYSGAEIVLNRYLDKNSLIDPYFALIYNSDEVYYELIKRYDENRIFKLEIKHKKSNLRYIPLIDAIKLKNKLKQIINDLKPDIILANNTIETMLIGLQSKHYNVPLVGFIHDMKSSIKSPIRRYYTKKAIRSIEQAITVSNACKNDWNENLLVLYNGLNKDFFKYTEHKKIENISYLGTLSYRKGIDIFLKVIEKVIQENSNIKIQICYHSVENNEYEHMIKQIKSKFNKNIKILKDIINNENLSEFYENVDILIVPSRRDPLPTVIMEALARGTLVIGSKIDGIPEMLDNNEQLMFDCSNSEELYRKLNYILHLNINTYNDITLDLFNHAYNTFNNITKQTVLNEMFNKLVLQNRNKYNIK